MNRRVLRMILLASAVSAACGASAADERVPVDVELVLAVDISYSMDHDELALQREGYIGAIASDQFLDAVRRGPHGRVAVSYVEWAGANEQQLVVPWQVVEDRASAERFVARLKAAPVRRAYRTSISAALTFSAALFGTNFKGIRRVIDVSGDGTNNQGQLLEPVRDEILRTGVTINGLPVMLKTPMSSMIDLPELDAYYRDCVIGGPGAFLVPVRQPAQFADAIRNKLLLEVAGIMPRGIPLPQPGIAFASAEKPRVSCTIGEEMWQQRWGGGR